MKFIEDRDGQLRIEAWGEQGVSIGGRWHQDAVLIGPDGIIGDWVVPALDSLSLEHLQQALGELPAILVIGTGPRSEIPPLGLRQALADAGVGLEFMDTPAACRTFGVVTSEGRRAAGLIYPV